MKRIKTMLGVTLLEVMLVLAIASMIIVMSIRYYQSAQASQQVNTILNQIQGIMAVADSISQNTGGYSGVTKAALVALLPGGTSNTPWGTDMLGALSPSATGYTIDLGTVPSTVCPLLLPKILNNSYLVPSVRACSGATAVTITYTANS